MHFSGGGNPWRCTVTRSPLPWRSSASYEPSKISVADREVSSRNRTHPAWQLIFLQNGIRREVLASPTTNHRIDTIGDQLEKARRTHASIEQDFPPDPVFFIAIGLVVIFFGCGAFIGWKGGSPSPDPHATPASQNRTHHHRYP